ncbi:MAG: RagB/SusD family nutrient uptake outer membrane protein [Longimicrobiales bacterium]
MNRNGTVSALLLAVLTASACDDSVLDIDPVDEISNEIAIVDEASARAALMGAYSQLYGDDEFYYAAEFVFWTETLTDNVVHTGTFEEFADGDLLRMTADNGALAGMWEDMYAAVQSVNLLIQQVPAIADLAPATVDEIVGQAYALRALHYFNLVRGWGGVPLVLEPLTLEAAGNVTRADVGAVYGQIEADLAQAEGMVDNAGIDNSERIFVTPGFIDALQAKVALYQEDFATAEAEAREVMDSGDYELASDYADLFTPEGTPTAEDIFRVFFTTTESNFLGFYYTFEGRFEIGASEEIRAAYEAGDERFDVNFDEERSDGIEVTKYPTANGAEDPHVIRYAEVLLILAEALAEQNGPGDLAEAAGYVNDVRARSGATAFAFVPGVTTQQAVLDVIYEERRLELAFEGDRWFDLVRTGRAAATLGEFFDPHEVLWPIPQSELDVAGGLQQNPGYL